MRKTNGPGISVLLELSQVLVVTGCRAADQTPTGFQVLGSKTPDRYDDYPIPSGFTEKMPENLNTVQMAHTAQEKSRVAHNGCAHRLSEREQERFSGVLSFHINSGRPHYSLMLLLICFEFALFASLRLQ